MSRIQLSDTIQDIIVKMSDGNPGALGALLELVKNTSEIDPDTIPGIGHVMALDSHEIYGSHIYILWNDVCGRDIYKFVLLLRATQLGLYDAVLLKKLSVDDPYSNLQVDDKVWLELQTFTCKELPAFKVQELV